jgi:hypothetical protein
MTGEEVGVRLPSAPPASQGTVIEQSRAIAEVAAAIRVAQDFPRDTNRAYESMRELCGRLAVAQRAFYEVPNRGAGLSVHIARELARLWGNLDYGVRELARDDIRGESEMQAWAWDQQTNTRTVRSFIVPHAKSLRGGGRKDLVDLNDIYLNNQNIGARAVRECIFAVLPQPLLSEAEQTLRATLERGDGKPIEQRRDDAEDAFTAIRVPLARLEKKVGKPKSQWTARDIAELVRAYTSITQDGIPAEDFFPEEAVQLPPAP